MGDYIKFIENDHIRPIKLEGKEQYYFDLENISNSWTGRVDADFTNKFIIESSHLIVNAIVLFEKGYFDCAYYSLRQSLEISTTMSYLLELNPEKRKKKIYDWNNQNQFPMDKNMLEFLEKNKDNYFDMFTKMNDYFEKIKVTKRNINKFIHKQGNEYFYVTRNHVMNRKYDENDYKKEFVKFLKICIGGVAILRLVVDPMPVLLMDKEIYHRIGDSMTKDFSQEFVEKYIGLENIEKYKETQMYVETFNDIMKEEKQEKCVTDVIKHHYIDKNKVDDILKQKHLLRKEQVLIVTLCGLIEKVVKAYTWNGIFMYFTNLDTNRKKLSWNGEFFYILSQKDKHINCEFDEAYISYFKFSDELEVYLEHNDILNESEIDKIKNLKLD